MSIIVKTPAQIDGIRTSCKLAAKALRWVEDQVRPGVSTGELDRLLEGFIRDHGATPAPLNYLGFPKATCISLNEVVCHGIPSDEMVLKDGDIVNIDVTTILGGYYGDCSSMFVLSPIADEAQRLLDVTKKCLAIGIAQVYPGNHFGNIGYEIMKYSMLQKCTVVYQFSGHGTGCFFHEEPQISHIATKDSGPRMKIGNIFTIEPMINLGVPEAVIDKEDGWTARTADGQLSAQYEHTVLVVPDGVEVLTIAES